jgi:hypothetical protein
VSESEPVTLTLSYEIYDEDDEEYRHVSYSVEANPQGVVRVIHAMDSAMDEVDDDDA